MKKIIALFGSLLILGSTKSKAQKPQQPVKKETVKPTSGTTPKTDAANTYLPLGGVKGETSASVVKGANPALIKGGNPTLKPWQSVPRQQAVSRQTPSAKNKKILGPR
jgi:hypothetical protein